MPDGISPFDIALGLPLLWAAIRGLRKGFVMEVTGLVALFLGAYAALFCSDLAAAWLDERFAIGHEYLGITSFAATFIASFCSAVNDTATADAIAAAVSSAVLLLLSRGGSSSNASIAALFA